MEKGKQNIDEPSEDIVIGRIGCGMSYYNKLMIERMLLDEQRNVLISDPKTERLRSRWRRKRKGLR